MKINWALGLAALFIATSAFADCPDFSGSYTLTFPTAPDPTYLTVTQSGCDSIDMNTDEGDGEFLDRKVVWDGQPHVTYSDSSETITETFTLSDNQISYTSTDNYTWDEDFVNQGTITLNADGTLTEIYNVFQPDGTFLYTTELDYAKKTQ